MYQAGDYIVYGTSGVCRVDEIKPSPFEDEADRQYYTLTPVTGTELSIFVGLAGFHLPVVKERTGTLVRDIPNIESTISRAAAVCRAGTIRRCATEP
ncbi:MAG: CarD family transcriptional regulator [Butyricicoccaceae bacterium]